MNDYLEPELEREKHELTDFDLAPGMWKLCCRCRSGKATTTLRRNGRDFPICQTCAARMNPSGFTNR